MTVTITTDTVVYKGPVEKLSVKLLFLLSGYEGYFQVSMYTSSFTCGTARYTNIKELMTYIKEAATWSNS
jgi:hypothetical protein